MPMTTERLKLPLLAAAQAQKEMTHNEALALADIAVQPVVVAVAPAAAPASPALGQCWIVGGAPTGQWAGQAGALACWTSGGWRFVAPFDGMQAWSLADQGIARRRAGVWVVGARQPRVSPPSGGATVDSEARAALAALITGLEAHGFFATN